MLYDDKAFYVFVNDEEYNYIFPENIPVIFVFHGYPNLIRELVLERKNKFTKVLGYQEEGAITRNIVKN